MGLPVVKVFPNMLQYPVLVGIPAYLLILASGGSNCVNF